MSAVQLFEKPSLLGLGDLRQETRGVERCQAGAVSGLPFGTSMKTTARVGPSVLAEPLVV